MLEYMKRRRLLPLLLSAALLLAGCSSGGNTAETSSYLISTDSVSSETASETAKETSSAGNDETVRNDPAPTAAEGVSCNGEAIANYGVLYTSDDEFGDYIGYTAMLSDSEAIFLYMIMPDGTAYRGMEMSGSDLSDNVMLYAMYLTENGADQYVSSEDPQVFDNLSFTINDFSNDEFADFTLSADFTHGGKTYSMSGSGRAEYVVQVQTTGGGSYEDDGTCFYCGGSGICTVCSGLGYTAWGGYENKIDCTSCGGTGSCYYCQGTGIQQYSVRDVPIG